jgi:type IV pilus assembly protein PilC
MPTFQYEARDRQGRAVKGQIDAPGMREAAAKLREEGVIVVSLSAVGGGSAFTRPGGGAPGAKKGKTGGRIKLKDMLMFTRQFSVMIRAGVNLVNCLNLIGQQAENQNLNSIVHELRASVEGGESLHVALSRFPKAFPPIYIYMIEAGEAGGQLDNVLERLSEHFEREFTLQKSITTAMVYPAVIATVATGAIFILVAFVLPQFATVFANAGIELPLMTRILMAIAGFFNKFWYLVILGAGGAAFGTFQYKKTPAGKDLFDRLFFKMPIIGGVVRKLSIARFTRTLATLLDSGVLITTALEIVERAVDNTVVAKALNTARVNLTRGSGLAGPLATTGIFPGMVTQMIAVGEETGELSTMLVQVADFYEKEAGYAVEGLTAMIEPAIIVMLGGVVAGIVTAVMLPLFEISSGGTMGK